MATKARKAIPISLARTKKTQSRNYHSPKKGSGAEPDKPALLLVKPEIPKAPKDRSGRNILGREGMREWRRVTGLLKNAQVVAALDRTLLTQYCVLWEQLVADKKGFTAAQQTQLRLCSVELGFTPAARAARLRG